MMKITCLTVGKKHDQNFASAIQEYEKRLSAYVNFSFDYIAPSDKTKESDQIIKRLHSDDVVWLLDERGTLFDNEKFIKDLEQCQLNSAKKRLVIIVGGAYGINASVRQRSDAILSLSKLVFPHQIVRLLLIEQLYRSFNALAGGKYHHS